MVKEADEEGSPGGHYKIKNPTSTTVFDQLVEIGFKHKADGIAWAKAEMEGMFKHCLRAVRNWPSWAYDDQKMNLSWRAPMLLLMEPVGREAFDHGRAMERMDEAGTSKVIDSLADYAVRRLRERLELAVRGRISGSS